MIMSATAENEAVEAVSNCLTRHLILVYSGGCCNVFKDLSGSKMSFTLCAKARRLGFRGFFKL